MASTSKKWADAAGAVAGAAADVAGQVVQKGRRSAQRLRLETQLAKVQRRLGMLYYTQHRGGPENNALAQRYMEEVDGLLEALAENYTPPPGEISWRTTGFEAEKEKTGSAPQEPAPLRFVAAAGHNHPKSRAFVWFSGKKADTDE